jgi:hypothetical protein
MLMTLQRSLRGGSVTFADNDSNDFVMLSKISRLKDYKFLSLFVIKFTLLYNIVV